MTRPAASGSHMSLDWNLLRTFVAVANQGSLAGAARSLGLAHPTVARHIQQLEDALELVLFDRRTSGLALNDTGDTSLLLGGAVDLDTGSMLLSLEASRRIADGWTAEIEIRAFAGADAGEPLYSLRRDDYARVAVVRYF